MRIKSIAPERKRERVETIMSGYPNCCICVCDAGSFSDDFSIAEDTGWQDVDDMFRRESGQLRCRNAVEAASHDNWLYRRCFQRPTNMSGFHIEIEANMYVPDSYVVGTQNDSSMIWFGNQWGMIGSGPVGKTTASVIVGVNWRDSLPEVLFARWTSSGWGGFFSYNWAIETTVSDGDLIGFTLDDNDFINKIFDLEVFKNGVSQHAATITLVDRIDRAADATLWHGMANRPFTALPSGDWRGRYDNYAMLTT